jgi:hypothetical protein
MAYLRALGLDLSEKPMRTRTSVRISSLYPPLSEYFVQGTWLGKPRQLEATMPGFLIEEASESGTAARAAG